MSAATIAMSQRLRVKIDARYKGIYNGLKNHAVGEFHELFFICVCLGHKAERSKPLSKREDCFWSSTILPDEWYAYYAIHLHDNEMDFSCLDSDAKVIDAMQKYASGGMEILIDELLGDYTKKDASGHYVVDHLGQVTKELLVKVTMDWSH